MTAARDEAQPGGGPVGPRHKAGGDGSFYDVNVGAARAGEAAWVKQRHDGQEPPPGDWTTWVFLGGRGAGKTRAGAEWVWDQAMRLGAGGRIALVGPTLHDVRAVMLEGPSGVLRLAHRTGARLEVSKRTVTFPGGAVGVMLSAEEPERLRGPQFHCGWGDEFCAWARAEETLAMLRLGVRLASSRPEGATPPRVLLTTTPKPVRALRAVLAEAGTQTTHAPTARNAANLAAGFLAGVEALYGGTRRAAQELEGVVLEPDGALFTRAEMDRARAVGKGCPARFEAVVVAVDPPAGTLSGEGGDACGIVAVGRAGGVCFVLADRSVRGLSPHGWAGRVRALAAEVGAGRIVVEANQGGAMAEALIAQEPTVEVRRVHARWAKAVRAEPVAALYEQGRVGHAPRDGEPFVELEEELMTLGVEDGAAGSPDQADALVWAVTELMSGAGEGPRIRDFGPGEPRWSLSNPPPWPHRLSDAYPRE